MPIEDMLGDGSARVGDMVGLTIEPLDVCVLAVHRDEDPVMTGEQRVYAAPEGKHVDRAPVASHYSFLYWNELDLRGAVSYKRTPKLAFEALRLAYTCRG